MAPLDSIVTQFISVKLDQYQTGSPGDVAHAVINCALVPSLVWMIDERNTQVSSNRNPFGFTELSILSLIPSSPQLPEPLKGT
jgi:hypothetical protein